MYDDDTLVRALLQHSGITPSEEEVQGFVSGLPANRELVASLYALPGVRYEEPATTFDPRP